MASIISLDLQKQCNKFRSDVRKMLTEIFPDEPADRIKYAASAITLLQVDYQDDLISDIVGNMNKED